MRKSHSVGRQRYYVIRTRSAFWRFCAKAFLALRQICRASGLSAPTVTNVVKDLLTENLIESLGEGESSGGRPPEFIRFKAERGCILV